ncbi:MAG: diphthamide synthesis protein [Candidatus Pacearchaeota archaeon]|jgi:diphthamide biosynthesis enzyme Dph1/Dph2-like protein
MKTLFIPAKSKQEINKKELLIISKSLPKEIAIFYSIQYFSQAKEIKKILSKKKIISFKQVLGCSKPKISKNTKAILLISDGKFHVTSIALETKLPTFIFINNKLTKISDEEIKNLGKRKKAAFVKFLNAEKIGILVSIKPGQENLEQAMKLKSKLKQKDSYLFLSNNINTNEFENFPQIQSWVNTACPRMDMNEKGIVNIYDI